MALRLEPSEKGRVEGARERCQRLAAFFVIEPAQALMTLRVMSEVDADAALVTRDRRVTARAGRIVGAAAPFRIEVQKVPQNFLSAALPSHVRGTEPSDLVASSTSGTRCLFGGNDVVV